MIAGCSPQKKLTEKIPTPHKSPSLLGCSGASFFVCVFVFVCCSKAVCLRELSCTRYGQAIMESLGLQVLSDLRLFDCGQ